MSTTGKNSMVRPYTMKELAAIYGISTKTFRKWLNPHQESIGERVGRLYTVRQIEIIFQLIGDPPNDIE